MKQKQGWDGIYGTYSKSKWAYVYFSSKKDFPEYNQQSKCTLVSLCMYATNTPDISLFSSQASITLLVHIEHRVFQGNTKYIICSFREKSDTESGKGNVGKRVCVCIR